MHEEKEGDPASFFDFIFVYPHRTVKKGLQEIVKYEMLWGLFLITFNNNPSCEILPVAVLSVTRYKGH